MRCFFTSLRIYNYEQQKDFAIKISNIPYCVAFPEGKLLFQVKWVKSLQRASFRFVGRLYIKVKLVDCVSKEYKVNLT